MQLADVLPSEIDRAKIRHHAFLLEDKGYISAYRGGLRLTSAGHDRLYAIRIEAISGHAADSLVLPSTRRSQF